MVCTSINGWELTPTKNGKIAVLDYDGFKVGEFDNETEAKSFCTTNEPLSNKINYWEVCLNVSVERRISDCCPKCEYATELFGVTSCPLDRDK